MHTLRAFSRSSISMLVHVRCMFVSRPNCSCAVLTKDMVASEVEPPAPHVMSATPSQRGEARAEATEALTDEDGSELTHALYSIIEIGQASRCSRGKILAKNSVGANEHSPRPHTSNEILTQACWLDNLQKIRRPNIPTHHCLFSRSACLIFSDIFTIVGNTRMDTARSGTPLPPGRT
jgi:hypothetical protein